MLQQLITAPFSISFREVDVPKITENQVLLKMMKIGICGSDIHVFHGKHPFVTYPLTQGHEVSAEVAAVGSNVKKFRVGQKVTVRPQIVCGECYPCTHGSYNLCEKLKVIGFQATGTASRYFAAEQENVIALPDEMSFDEGALIEPLAVAVHAIKKARDITGKKVVVLGAGPIGNLVAQTAKGMGAEKVMITDIADWRLKKARECGIDICINTAENNLGDAILANFGPDKADVIYDCAGTNTSMGQAIKYARKGSTIILIAVFAGPATVDLATLNDHELDLGTSMMYLEEDYLDAVKLAQAKKVSLLPLISKNFPFTEYQKAYEFIEESKEKCMKVLIDVQR
jgi:L-iditol 2-dehydrogenase